MEYMSLAEIHKAEAEMLKWLANICENNNIPLCLSGGTVLGAIRHKGFIPWDDDIDLMLPRQEYDRLILLLEQLNDNRYSIVSMRDGISTFSYAKLIDKEIVLEQEEDTYEVTSNLWIDIFPVDGLQEDTNKVKGSYRHTKFLRMGLRVASSRNMDAGSKLKRFVKPLVILPAKIVGAHTWVKKLDRYCRKIEFGSTNNVGVLCAGYGYKECMPYDEWIKYTKVEFEGEFYWVPGCWEYYLRSLYGDYMKLPPEDKRHTHDLKAYRRNHSELT